MDHVKGFTTFRRVDDGERIQLQPTRGASPKLPECAPAELQVADRKHASPNLPWPVLGLRRVATARPRARS